MLENVDFKVVEEVPTILLGLANVMTNISRLLTSEFFSRMKIWKLVTAKVQIAGRGGRALHG